TANARKPRASRPGSSRHPLRRVDSPMSDTLVAARRALEEGALHDAQRLLETALRQDPGSAEATHLLGRLRFATGDHAGAAELLRTAFERRPDSAEFAHDLGF